MEQFEAIQNLGTGSFGAVKLVRERESGKQLAMKVLSRKDASKYVEAEIVNHSLLRHPHIVQFREVFLSDEHVHIGEKVWKMLYFCHPGPPGGHVMHSCLH